MAVKPIPYEANVASLGIDENELKAYINIARGIGFLPTEILRPMLLSFFKDKNIKIFDYRDVFVYLAKQGMSSYSSQIGSLWVWHPLRDRDTGYDWKTHVNEDDEEWKNRIRPLVISKYGGRLKESEAEFKHPVRHIGSWIHHRGFYNPEDQRPYQKVIPMRVLDRVREIEEYIPGKIQFFVSDYADTQLRDPFIAAKIGQSRSFDDVVIFDCWDEPGFTG